jgi:tetratricopeptide (TPR) repeat protein
MNPVIRIALLLVALLAVVIAGSYFYSRSLKTGDVTEVTEVPARSDPTPELLLGDNLNPDLAEGLQALQDNRLEEARASLEKVPEVDPGYLLALRNLGQVLGLLGDWEGALEVLERLGTMQLDNRDTLAALSQVQFRLGDFDAAELSALRALEIEPGDPMLRFDLALYRVAQDRLPEAVDTYQRAIELDPDRTRTMQALQRLMSLHDAHPDVATSHYALAYFARRLARLDLEIQELEHFLQTEPSGQAAQFARQRLDEALAQRSD